MRKVKKPDDFFAEGFWYDDAFALVDDEALLRNGEVVDDALKRCSR